MEALGQKDLYQPNISLDEEVVAKLKNHGMREDLTLFVNPDHDEYLVCDPRESSRSADIMEWDGFQPAHPTRDDTVELRDRKLVFTVTEVLSVVNAGPSYVWTIANYDIPFLAFKRRNDLSWWEQETSSISAGLYHST